MREFLQFVITGVVVGAIMGRVLSLVSGNWYVIVGVSTLGMLIGITLGIVHRNDP